LHLGIFKAFLGRLISKEEKVRTIGEKGLRGYLMRIGKLFFGPYFTNKAYLGDNRIQMGIG